MINVELIAEVIDVVYVQWGYSTLRTVGVYVYQIIVVYVENISYSLRVYNRVWGSLCMCLFAKGDIRK